MDIELKQNNGNGDKNASLIRNQVRHARLLGRGALDSKNWYFKIMTINLPKYLGNGRIVSN
jgi:hypothetical protein